MSRYWIKLYHEVLADPKMGRLSDRLYRRTIELFLLAGQEDKAGYLPELDEMAWILRLDPQELYADLEALAATNIVQLRDEGWIVTKFAERQDAETGAERVSRYRQAKRMHGEPVTKRYPAVTQPVTNGVRELELKIESELEIESEQDSPPPTSAAQSRAASAGSSGIFQLYEQQIGILTPMIAESLKDAERQYPTEWVHAAFREAARANVHSWAYVDAILQRWQADGQMSLKRNGRPPPKNGAATTVFDKAREELSKNER